MTTAAVVTIIGGIVGIIIGLRSCDPGPGPGPGTTTKANPVTETPPSTESNPVSPATTPPSSAARETKYLVDMEPLSTTYGVDSGSVELRGETLPQSISLRVDKNSLPANEAEYNLGGQWEIFDATIGVTDTSPTGGRLTFEVLGDGRTLRKVELAKGSPAKVHLEVSGMQTLKLKVRFTAGEYYNDYSYGAWGDARLTR
ncbi:MULTISPECIES: NPCBM/NEW2 domain-containing protein [Streptomyces]|uniref:NPCBM/NEW2 domain-containing protein n=1 Tax=Streptomyces TaxID=1883 RepID=UPI0012FF2DEC|nr:MULTISPECIES: NPCBM/NEW2 domain-containing protein [Streptomyces]